MCVSLSVCVCDGHYQLVHYVRICPLIPASLFRWPARYFYLTNNDPKLSPSLLIHSSILYCVSFYVIVIMFIVYSLFYASLLMGILVYSIVLSHTHVHETA